MRLEIIQIDNMAWNMACIDSTSIMSNMLVLSNIQKTRFRTFVLAEYDEYMLKSAKEG